MKKATAQAHRDYEAATGKPDSKWIPKMQKTIKLRVTSEIIEESQGRMKKGGARSANCPLALAARNVPGVVGATIGVVLGSVCMSDGLARSIRLSGRAIKFRDAFDRDRPATPKPGVFIATFI